jgi:hypothetical protein
MYNASKLALRCVAALIVGAALGSAYAGEHAEGSQFLRAERLYADFLDDQGAVGAIESGIVHQIEGRGLRDWRVERDKNKDQLIKEFNELGAKPLNKSELRIFGSMRRTFDELMAEGSESKDPHARCSDAALPASIGVRLRADLYACFDSLGNRIEFDGRRLTRVAALQMSQEMDDPARRREIFYAMAPLWVSINAGDEPDSPYRRLIRPAADDFKAGRSSINAAARTLGIGVQEAERWLVEMLDAWRIANAGDPRPVEPWDYRYHYAAASRGLAKAVPKSALLPTQQRFYRDLGADPEKLGILFDIDPRPGKAPLAYSDTVRIGRSIDGKWRSAISRVSANDDRGGLGILNELVHETGHAVHYLAIKTRPAFFWPDIAFIESFADVPSWSVYSPAWQSKYLGAAVSRSEGLREQYAGVMLDVAWSLFELRMLRHPAADPNQIWTDIARRYLNIVPHPEISWWAIRSQLVTDPGYMMNYGLGALMTAEIRAKTAASIGSFDAGNPRWFVWTSEHLLRFGAEMETTQLMRQFLGHPVSPSALIAEIRSIDGSDGKPRR